MSISNRIANLADRLANVIAQPGPCADHLETLEGIDEELRLLATEAGNEERAIEGEDLFVRKVSVCWELLSRALRQGDSLETHRTVLEGTEKRLRRLVVVADSVTEFQVALSDELSELYDMLSEKNARYGNSAMEPVRIFSKANPVEQLKVRIDDKLSRIVSSDLETDGEDVVMDLIGYLLIYRMATKGE